MIDPYKTIAKLESQNKQFLDVIEQLNKTLRRQEARMKAVEKRMPELVKNRVEEFTARHEQTAVDATKIIAEICKISPEVRRSINEAVG